MSQKRNLLVWALVLTIMLISIAWTGCSASEPKTTAPLEPSQWPREEGFVPRATGILSMLAATEDEVIDTALQEAVDEGRITGDQAGNIRIWWALRPEVLSPDVFPREMPER